MILHNLLQVATVVSTNCSLQPDGKVWMRICHFIPLPMLQKISVQRFDALLTPGTQARTNRVAEFGYMKKNRMNLGCHWNTQAKKIPLKVMQSNLIIRLQIFSKTSKTSGSASGCIALSLSELRKSLRLAFPVKLPP
jgi:hypothetical protein